MKAVRMLAAIVVAVAASLAAAQDYPGNKPIRLIVPFPAGGGTDIFARVIGNKLTETQKWVVVIDNKPGAGGNIGIDAVAKSPGDGYTIGLGSSGNLIMAPHLYPKLGYVVAKDVAPLSASRKAPSRSRSIPPCRQKPSASW